MFLVCTPLHAETSLHFLIEVGDAEGQLFHLMQEKKCFVTFRNGCTEKPDTVRYADTVRYRTDSRGRLTELARAVSVLLHLIRRGGNRAS